MKRLLAVVASVVALAGCSTVPTGPDSQVSVEDVMRRIKQELAEYYAYKHAHENDPAFNTVCAGAIEFNIKSVTVTLASESDDTAGVNGSASVPTGVGTSVGPSVDLEKDVKSSKTLKYTFYPIDPGPGPAPASTTNWVGYPVASSLEQLRSALLQASDTLPCETFSAPAEVGPPRKAAMPADQTVTFDFTVERTGKDGLDLKFVLFSVDPTSSHQVQTGNNVVVTFVAAPKRIGIH